METINEFRENKNMTKLIMSICNNCGFKITLDALCQKDAKLLTADTSLIFMVKTLSKQNCSAIIQCVKISDF